MITLLDGELKTLHEPLYCSMDKTMSIAVKTKPSPAKTDILSVVPQLYRFSVKQYDRMIELGILTAGDRVELLKGYLIEKMARNPPHDSTVSRINKRLLRVLPVDWTLRVQSALVLRDSEPEPDFAIVRGSEETYDRRKPVPRDVGLLIEVADSTLLEDRQFTAVLYAEARIGEYWIVNLAEQQIEVYTGPKSGKAPGYKHQQIYKRGDALPLILDGKEIARLFVNELLPR